MRRWTENVKCLRIRLLPIVVAFSENLIFSSSKYNLHFKDSLYLFIVICSTISFLHQLVFSYIYIMVYIKTFHFLLIENSKDKKITKKLSCSDGEFNLDPNNNSQIFYLGLIEKSCVVLIENSL